MRTSRRLTHIVKLVSSPLLCSRFRTAAREFEWREFRNSGPLLFSQLRLERGELRLNVLLRLALTDDLFAITAQEIVDGFHANLDGAGRFVLVKILKTEVRRTGPFDDPFDHAVNRRVVSTLEAGNLEGHEIGMPRGELGGPHLVVGAARVGVFPGIIDFQRARDHPGSDLFAEEPFEQVFIERKRVLRKDGVTEFLELIENLVIESRIVVIGAGQHDDADAVFAFELIEHLPRTLANAGFVFVQRRESRFHRAIVFLQRKPEDWLPGLQHLVGEELAIREVEHWIDVLQIVFGEDVIFLGERGFHGFWSGRHGRAGIRAGNFKEGRMQNVVHRKEDDVERLFAMLLLDEVVDVGDSDLCRETRIDGAAVRARAVEFRTGVIGINDVLRLYSQTFEVRAEQRRIGINVQDARNADADLAAVLHEGDALLVGFGPCSPGNWIGDTLRVRRAEDLFRGDIHEIGMPLPNLLESGLDVFHIVQVFDGSFFARGDDEPLLAAHERHLGDALDRHEVLYRLGPDIDKGAQAVVLAEIATRRFIAGGAVFNLAHRVQADERGLPAVAPQAQRFLCCADGS